MAGYIAVGHGLKSTGVFDPGAMSNAIREHDLAHGVAAVIADAFARSGEPAVSEVHGPGDPEDPNWAGSVQRINAGGFLYAIEVHFDWSGAPPGGFGLYVSTKGQRMAEHVRGSYEFLGLPVRPNVQRTDLGFLNGTRCPALIWECGPVGSYMPDAVVLAGEAIAAGVLGWVHEAFNPSINYVPWVASTPAPTPDPLVEQLRAALEACQQSSRDVTAVIDQQRNQLQQAKALAAQIINV